MTDDNIACGIVTMDHVTLFRIVPLSVPLCFTLSLIRNGHMNMLLAEE